jgi:precorrin-6B methylase 2
MGADAACMVGGNGMSDLIKTFETAVSKAKKVIVNK